MKGIDKMHGSKILPVNKPMITTYTQHAHLLSILGGNSKIHPWIFSNYIQIYINKDYSKHQWGDFYFPLPYELRPSDTCKWLYTQKIDKYIINERYESLIDFVAESLESNYYVHLILNYSHLSISTLKRCHDILIYGINMDEEVLYVSDFFRDGIYSNEKLSFSEFISAFPDYIPHDENYLNGLINLYKIKDECDYQFNIKNVENSIMAYLSNTTPEYWEMYNMDNRNDIVFGTQIYETLNRYIDIQLAMEGGYIDIRPFYLIFDHKQMMVLRLKYLHELGFYKKLDQNYNITEMEQIAKEARNAINLLIKYFITKNIEYIDKVKCILTEIKRREYEILKLYTENSLD